VVSDGARHSAPSESLFVVCFFLEDQQLYEFLAKRNTSKA